ncbi:efflux RND transporter periplasmic adaptor subunit [uncultured Propionivibrio sp.]|uniref:efflux RND transporter periplasmic adaptor subunit n=1 Tax=uncultured Propionivibrio sp. TaxID=426737 RepID=UPI0029C07C69|nr:efflux RND transporter periplasmic adaptor subunit [uncultured Propionivibrio sp.]
MSSATKMALLALVSGSMLLTACTQKSEQAAASNQTQSAEKPGEEKTLSSEHSEAGKIKLSAKEIEEAGLRFQTVESQAIAEQIALTATIRANQDRVAHVAPRVPARLVKVSANLGDKVKAGQSLASLDSLELGEAHSVYRQARSQAALAKADFERAEKLRADEIIPEKDFLRARSEFEKARAAHRAAEERLRLLDAAHSDAEEGPASIFSVFAPFSGTVIEKHAILGELAQPDKNLYTVADLSTVWIEANLFEKDLGLVRVGAPASVTVNAYPGEVFQGKLTYISSTVDRETRAVQARVEVANTDGRLKPEMFATASVATPNTVKGMTIPQEALLLVNRQPVVFVQEGEGFEMRPVDPGEKIGNRIIVKSGLTPGESVVVVGAFALKARLLKSQISDEH